MRLIDLKQKEIINICTCSSMGCPADVEFNSRTGRITALVVPGCRQNSAAFWDGENDIVIPWERICQIGEGHYPGGDSAASSPAEAPGELLTLSFAGTRSLRQRRPYCL